MQKRPDGEHVDPEESLTEGSPVSPASLSDG